MVDQFSCIVIDTAATDYGCLGADHSFIKPQQRHEVEEDIPQPMLEEVSPNLFETEDDVVSLLEKSIEIRRLPHQHESFDQITINEELGVQDHNFGFDSEVLQNYIHSHLKSGFKLLIISPFMMKSLLRYQILKPMTYFQPLMIKVLKPHQSVQDMMKIYQQLHGNDKIVTSIFSLVKHFCTHIFRDGPNAVSTPIRQQPDPQADIETQLLAPIREQAVPVNSTRNLKNNCTTFLELVLVLTSVS